MDVDKLRAILAVLQGTDVTRLTWVEGQESIDLRLGHPPPPAPIHAVPVAAAPVAQVAVPPSAAPVAAPPSAEKSPAPKPA